jgi:predicted phosphodiesterase
MATITKKLNKLGGKILIFGGVYSNLQALEALYNQSIDEKIEPDHIICTGDIIGYCAQPAECVDFVKSWGIHSILGNVEKNIIDGKDDCGCNFTEGGRCDLLSRQWFPYALSKISDQHRAFLQTLPDYIEFDYAKIKVTVLHGSTEDISEFIFKSTPWETKHRSFQNTQSNIILAGHSGIPFSDQKNNLLWLNAGVIGMPANDGTTDVWYMILEERNDKIHFSTHRLTYDHCKASELMKQSELPEGYANTLLTGIWDNCEILPHTETKEQGKKIIEISDLYSYS